MRVKMCFIFGLIIISVLCVSNAGFAINDNPEVVKMGVILPLSGRLALDGAVAKIAIDVAVDIVNNSYDSDNLMARTEGFPNLGGAKLEVVYADTQAIPEKGMSETERLITSEGVCVIFGPYTSAVASTAQLMAEKYQIPMASTCTSPMLYRKDLDWFFGFGPDDLMFFEDLFKFLTWYEDKTEGYDIENIAVIHEDSLWGADCATILKDLIPKYGYKQVESISFVSGTVDLSSELLKIKSSNPDILFQMGYGQDQILLINTMKLLDINVDAIIGGTQYDAVFEALGKYAEGLMNREVFIDEYADYNDNARFILDKWHEVSSEPMANAPRYVQSVLVLSEIINRAGTTDPHALRQAFLETDIPAEKLFIPWDGIAFNEIQQNYKSNGIVVQWIDGENRQIYPEIEDYPYEAIMPLPKWSER